MKTHFSKEWRKTLLIMLTAVFAMGFSLSLLVLTHFGIDPCSCMNYGISRLTGISFGTCQVLLNLALLLFVLLFYRSSIGLGTLANMVLIGYTADFFTWIWRSLLHIPEQLSLTARVMILIPGILIFVISAAFYMNSGHGVAPYDAIPFIMDEAAMKKNGGKSHFKLFRFGQDLTCSCIGILTGGEYGVITFLMVILLAPTVQIVGKLFQKKFHTED